VKSTGKNGVLEEIEEASFIPENQGIEVTLVAKPACSRKSRAPEISRWSLCWVQQDSGMDVLIILEEKEG
jgi:hypothetical protein